MTPRPTVAPAGPAGRAEPGAASPVPRLPGAGAVPSAGAGPRRRPRGEAGLGTAHLGCSASSRVWPSGVAKLGHPRPRRPRRRHCPQIENTRSISKWSGRGLHKSLPVAGDKERRESQRSAWPRAAAGAGAGAANAQSVDQRGAFAGGETRPQPCQQQRAALCSWAAAHAPASRSPGSPRDMTEPQKDRATLPQGAAEYAQTPQAARK